MELLYLAMRSSEVSGVRILRELLRGRVEITVRTETKIVRTKSARAATKKIVNKNPASRQSRDMLLVVQPIRILLTTFCSRKLCLTALADCVRTIFLKTYRLMLKKIMIRT